MQTMVCKKALIRDADTPAGQPGTMHVNCECGARVPMSDAGGTCAQCGQSYDSRGWLIRKAAQS